MAGERGDISGSHNLFHFFLNIMLSALDIAKHVCVCA